MRILLTLLISLPIYMFSETFVIYGGKSGWIGQKLMQLVQEQGMTAIAGKARIENRQAVLKELSDIQPDFVLNAAGVTGRPNVDWCELNKITTIRANLIGALNLADVTHDLNIHMTNFGTGCIYEYDEDHLIEGKPFNEEDSPNFTGSFYSKTKVMLDSLFDCYDNVLNLRLRMPISSDLHPRNFITKLSKYTKLIDIPNSVTILDDLLPVSIDMTLKGLKGKFNFVNPGTVSHSQVMQLYISMIDPSHTYQIISLNDLDKLLLAKRSNNHLNVDKLLSYYPDIPEANESLIRVFERIKHGLN